MPREDIEDDDLLHPEIRQALRALRHAINIQTSVKTIHRFQESIQNPSLPMLDRHVRDLISILDQRGDDLREESLQAMNKAQQAFHQLSARNRRKVRAYYRDDLRTYLDIQNFDGPLEIFGEQFQDTQGALFRAVDLRRKLLHLRRVRLTVPCHMRSMQHPVIDRLMQDNQREAMSLEHDQIVGERLLNVRFQGLSEDEQNLFWLWYESDMKACGFQKITGTRYFRFTAMRPTIVVTEHE
ncbi:hypothetical protein N7457_004051 [Penicillium paradoxum]|uniref:uncharacterized protein n=1 Tax=Penicillium paradoxum TaxID=176176 RepID=UPI002546B449|nr:uncharacterized protein N7457_004051 [Penicillium paradoxum]KAJ5782277.1 hypothetical protein N7457_004051 [Penicillium paradoxum]